MGIIQRIQAYFNRIDAVLSIQVEIDSAGNYLVNKCVLALKKGVVQTEDAQKWRQEQLDKLPVVLSIDGKGVLHKSVNESVEQVAFARMFPNASEEEFVVQKVAGGESVTHFSIVRKNSCEAVLQELKLDESRVLGVYLGVYFVKELRVLGGLPEKIGNYQLNWSGENLVSVEKLKERVVGFDNVLDYQVAPNLTQSFLNGLYVLINGFNNTNIAAAFQVNNLEYKGKKQFKIIGVSALVFFLVLLLGNFMWLKQIEKGINKIALTNGQKLEQLEQLNELETQLKDKQSFVDDLGLKRQASYGFLVDEIGQTVPKTIQLTELHINPTEKAIRKDKEITYSYNRISVGGLTRKSLELNEWKRDLSALKWVKKVALIDYGINKNGVGEFILDIEF